MSSPSESSEVRPKRKRVLLVVCPALEESAHKISQGVARYIREHEYWETYLDNKGLSLGDPRWVEREKWDGVISRHTSVTQVKTCASLGIPLIDVNNATPFASVFNVELDNLAVGRQGAEHFIERGFFNVGFCGFSNELWSLQRRKGFEKELKLPGRSIRLLETNYPGGDTPEWDAAEIETLTAWLIDAPKPFAVMGCNDFRALQLINAAESAGLRIPEDVAVLGANDDEVRCELARVPLSSVATNHVQSGYKAAEALDQLMKGRSLQSFKGLVSPVGVVARRSTDVLAVSDRRVAVAMKYISDHGCEAITVADVCRQAGIARTQLEQKFRLHFSRSPQAEIRRVRLDRVRRMLHQTDLPLRAIADLCGFEHVEYMSVFFKKAVGQSPGRYRRTLKTL